MHYEAKVSDQLLSELNSVHPFHEAHWSLSPDMITIEATSDTGDTTIFKGTLKKTPASDPREVQIIRLKDNYCAEYV